MRSDCLATALALLLVGACTRPSTPAPPPPVPAPPRLTVLVVLEQLRADELTDYAALWRYGLRQLLQEGRHYTQAFLDYGGVSVAAGHATLATGLTPRLHGVVSDPTKDPQRGTPQDACDHDDGPCVAAVLQAETLGDRLKSQHSAAKVAVFARRAVAAMALGGRRADLVVWDEPDTLSIAGRGPAVVGHGADGGSGLPRWLVLFREQIATADRIAHLWELPRLPAPFSTWSATAPGQDDCGIGTRFPHRLPKGGSQADLARAWHCLPDSDRALQETVLRAARHMGFGSDEVPDLLAVSFGSLERVGHVFGDKSLERLAALLELDRQLGDLLSGLRELVGPRVLVALTSSRGLVPKAAVPPTAAKSSGRVAASDLIAAARVAVQAALEGHPEAGLVRVQLAFPFLTLGDLSEGAKRKVIPAAVAALREHPAVHGSWPTAALDVAADPIASLLRESAFPGRCGDIAIALKPHHVLASGLGPDGSLRHGTPWPYDRHVPVVLWGLGVSPGKIAQAVVARGVVRTLADRLGLSQGPHAAEPLP